MEIFNPKLQCSLWKKRCKGQHGCKSAVGDLKAVPWCKTEPCFLELFFSDAEVKLACVV